MRSRDGSRTTRCSGGLSMPHPSWKSRGAAMGACLFVALAFALDAWAPLPISSGVIYLATMLLALTLIGPRSLLAVAAGCSGLIVVGYVLRPTEDHTGLEIINR